MGGSWNVISCHGGSWNVIPCHVISCNGRIMKCNGRIMECNGRIMESADKTAAFVMDVYERLVLMSQQCNFSTRASGRHDVGGGTKTTIEVSKLAKQMQSMQATMLSMQSIMTNQGNGDVPFDRCVGSQEEVQAIGYQQRDMGGAFSQTYSQKWQNHPNLSWINNNALNSNMLNKGANQTYNNNQGYYQGEGSGNNQSNQWNQLGNFYNN
ncbi:hypothetical protein LWI29_027157 [Acer saccharum]|uniref:Uncharacterized protein n=1 Tax=Acer saccharum TaxID=4024 RepID=A0AA39TGZ6_ACESA|nr:hypothetical protein LWI29_027157 [Acer saccharum]